MAMGTSSSHRSPKTQQWERVKRLYRENSDAAQVSARIAAALDGGTRRELAGAGVVSCLEALLLLAHRAAQEGLSELASTPSGVPPLLWLSQSVRGAAERAISQHGYASRFSDLALNALGTATFEAGSGGASSVFDIRAGAATAALARYAEERRLHDLSLCFVAHDFDHLFRHLVTRDSADYVGGGSLATVTQASQLRDAVGAYCREAVALVEATAFEECLCAAVGSAPEDRAGKLGTVLAELTALSLDRLMAPRVPPLGE